MEDPKIKTKVVHSQSKTAWNIVGETLGRKYKIARIPYTMTNNDEINSINFKEALAHANFIRYCFNNSDKILQP